MAQELNQAVFDFLQTLCTKVENLPNPDPNDPTSAIIPESSKKRRAFLNLSDFSTDQRICARCSKEFKVDADGYPVDIEEKCQFHFTFFDYFPKCMDCKQANDTPPCHTRPHHVIRETNHPLRNKGFVGTSESSGKRDVYAFQTHFMRTTHGKEVCQLKIVNWNEEIVLDTLIKPSGRILDTALDFRVHYEKIPLTEEDVMRDGVPTLPQVQKMIQEMISADSILVTKSASQQLILLKLFHQNVIELGEVYLAKKEYGGRPVAARIKDAIRQNLDDPSQFLKNGSVIESEVPLICMKLIKKSVEKNFEVDAVWNLQRESWVPASCNPF